MFLVIINAINFIDGIDGLAITEIIKTILLIEFFSASPTILTPLGTIIVLSLIPLYYFNFKKSRKVFLGDGGSLLFGTIVSIYIFYVIGNEYQLREGFKINKVLFAILVILYPLIDLLRVFILRIKDGNSPFKADQKHLHHRIVNKISKHYLALLFIISLELITVYLCIELVKT